MTLVYFSSFPELFEHLTYPETVMKKILSVEKLMILV